MYSVYDLVDMYKNIVCPHEEITKEEEERLIKTTKEVLDKGFTSQQVINAIEKYDELYLEFDMKKIIKGKGTKNLLKSKTFYYHNLLRCTCSPPLKQFDIESGEIITLSEPYFLEMRASITVREVAEYFVKQTGLKIKTHEYSRIEGSIAYLLKSYSVEEILFMIDSTVNAVMSGDYKPISSPLNISVFYDEAKITRDKKRTETIQSGGRKIERKRRPK